MVLIGNEMGMRIRLAASGNVEGQSGSLQESSQFDGLSWWVGEDGTLCGISLGCLCLCLCFRVSLFEILSISIILFEEWYYLSRVLSSNIAWMGNNELSDGSLSNWTRLCLFKDIYCMEENCRFRHGILLYNELIDLARLATGMAGL